MTVGTRSEELKQRAYHEFKEFVVIALYLWVIFSLFLLYKSVILNERIRSVAQGIALINALVLGLRTGMTLAVALVSCIGATGQDVRHNYMPGVDFSKYHTYKWINIEGGAHPN